jgi:hypothetical protein
MCIVVDINSFPSVFDTASTLHSEYAPVLRWVIEGRGKLVCGGTKYWDELEKLAKYVKLINQLQRAGKLVKVENIAVDQKMKQLQAICNDSDFDDPHIAALLIVSGCKVICTEDKRSYPYITRREWYPKHADIPKIYTRRAFKNANSIICDSNIADICLPCKKLKKEETQNLIF